MKIEHTLYIIKPNAVAKNITGLITHHFENIRLSIISAKVLKLTSKQAKRFYVEHKNKSFFKNLVNFMISGLILVQVLKRENVVYRHREITGITNYINVILGILKPNYSNNSIENTVHSSDSTQSATREIAYFFSKRELYTRI